MSKFTDAIVATLKSYFEQGDKPTEAQFAAWIQAIQEGIQEHGHVSTGGAGTGTGDAGPAARLQYGLDAEKPESPAEGDIYIATDTATTYVCYSAGGWSALGGDGGAQKFWIALDPKGATYPTAGVSPAELVLVDGVFYSWYEARFDAASDEALYFQFAIPATYSQGNLKVTLFWKAAATTGDVEWYLQFTYRSDGEVWAGEPEYGKEIVDTTKGTTEALNTCSATFTDHPADNDMAIIQVYRNAGGAADTMAGDAKLLGVLIEEI